MNLRLTPARRRRRRRAAVVLMIRNVQDLLAQYCTETSRMLNEFSALSHANTNFLFPTLLMFMVHCRAIKYRIGRHLWTAHPENEFGNPCGFWEKEVLGTWERARVVSPGWWKNAWISNFRMEKITFCFLLERYGHLMEKQVTHLRRTIPREKRLAILLYYLCQAETFSEIGVLFHVGTTTVGVIVHELVQSLVEPITSDAIVFPVGRQLQRTMKRFEKMANLPMCCGAVDGTFVRMVKPEHYGDLYWCYKQHPAVLLLACVDSRGLFTYVDVGAPGSVGDAAVYNNSVLRARFLTGQWGNYPTWQCNDKTIRPYLVGDSAFSLSPILMKIYSGDNLTPAQASFNFAQIRTRRVVECAFGRLKPRFPVVAEINSNDPYFTSKVCLLCCGLHNVIERKAVGHLPCNRNYEPVPLVAMNPSSGENIRDALSNFVLSL